MCLIVNRSKTNDTCARIIVSEDEDEEEEDAGVEGVRRNRGIKEDGKRREGGSN